MAASSFPAPAFSAHVLDQADWARLKLQPFAGRTVRVAMMPFSLSFAIDSDGRLHGSDATSDLDIVLPANTPFLALQGNDQVMKAAQIKGPADLADALSFVLRNLRWDIEEDLAKVFGDVVAHRMAGALNAFADWHRKAAVNLAENATEYFVEENPTLVKPAEMSAFVTEVAQLREQIANIESRIKGLK
jgi:ubiquinone biosynthesis accessory factor UbiJ